MSQRAINFPKDVYPYFIEDPRGVVRILFWVEGDVPGKDRFICQPDGRVVAAADSRDVRNCFGDSPDVIIHWSDSATLNVKRFLSLSRRLKSGRGMRSQSCKQILNGWNFIEDMLNTLGIPDRQWPSHRHALSGLYQKIFRGSNLPALTPEGQEFMPIFNEREVRSFHSAMMDAWKLIGCRVPEFGGAGDGLAGVAH